MKSQIEFTHVAKTCGGSKIIREVYKTPVTFKMLKDCVEEMRFNGMATVIQDGEIVYKANVVEGKFHGVCVKYDSYCPKTVGGAVSGYFGGWRQPILKCKYIMGLLDGEVCIYNKDGSKKYILKYNMGKIDGEQKHYKDYSKCVHKFKQGEWVEGEKVSKSWIWNEDHDVQKSRHEIICVDSRLRKQ